MALFISSFVPFYVVVVVVLRRFHNLLLSLVVFFCLLVFIIVTMDAMQEAQFGADFCLLSYLIP